MNFTCNECNDTGSRDKSGDYLDCGHCDAAMQRKALNDWLALQHKQGAIAKVDSMDAWLIHQRALAMAPKQEAPTQEPVKQDCGACHGSGWVSRDADIGTEQECFSCDGTGKSDDAAPAVANGALTDADILTIIWKYSNFISVGNYSSTQFDCQADTLNCIRAILAAAGPDAALPDFCFEDNTDFMHRLDLLMNTKWPEMRKDGLARKISELANAHIRAAISGAKGN